MVTSSAAAKVQVQSALFCVFSNKLIMSQTEVESSDELKEKGNACVQEQKYAEAVLLYTKALLLDPNNYTLHSNRSLAFLKMQQYYLAMEDALATIKLAPTWPKGYFRKGEIEFQTHHFCDALSSYGRALAFEPDNPSIRQAVSRTSEALQQERKADEQIPWLGAGIGIILGVSLIIADQTIPLNPTISHPIVMALLTVACALKVYGIARVIRYFYKCQRKCLLEPPMNLLPENNKKISEDSPNDAPAEQNGERTERSPRFTKAQARHRFKKGKK